MLLFFKRTCSAVILCVGDVSDARELPTCSDSSALTSQLKGGSSSPGVALPPSTYQLVPTHPLQSITILPIEYCSAELFQFFTLNLVTCKDFIGTG